MDSRLFLLLLSVAVASDATSNWNVVLRVLEDCGSKNDSLTCLQRRALSLANRVSESRTIEIVRGLKFVRDENARSIDVESARGNSSNESNDEIWSRLNDFLTTHSVEVNIPRFTDSVNLLEQARKKKGGYGGILLLAGAAKGAMLYMGMQAVAALAGKALLVAKVALTIASVIALKKLLDGGGGGGKTSYEIIKHPQHSYVQTHSSSHEYGHGNGHGGGYEGHY